MKKVTRKIPFIKDTKQTNALITAAKRVGKRAIRASRALGLTISYIEDGEIMEESADGKKKLVGRLATVTTKVSSIKMKLIAEVFKSKITINVDVLPNWFNRHVLPYYQ